MDFSEEVVEFTFKGEKHQVRKPSNGDIKKYNKTLKKCESEDDKENALITFLAELGLSEQVFDQLNPSQSEVLLKGLYEAEKN